MPQGAQWRPEVAADSGFFAASSAFFSAAALADLAMSDADDRLIFDLCLLPEEVRKESIVI